VGVPSLTVATINHVAMLKAQERASAKATKIAEKAARAAEKVARKEARLIKSWKMKLLKKEAEDQAAKVFGVGDVVYGARYRNRILHSRILWIALGCTLSYCCHHTSCLSQR
jgi:hypothetical protein